MDLDEDQFSVVLGDAGSLVERLSLSNVVVAVTVGWIAYGIGLAIHRGFINPLSRIPGPFLAGVSYWYEAYYEVWRGGQYFKHVTELHRRYGPIVRITPHEIHFNDPEFIDSVYPGSSRKTNKPHWYPERTGTPDSIVSTIDHDLHRRRRNAISGFFSAASIRRLEPIMKKYLGKLITRMAEMGKSQDVVQMHGLFKACASDVITVYAFGECLDFMEQPDFGKGYFDASDWFFRLTHVFGLFPGLVAKVQTVPSWVIRSTAPFLSALRDRQDWWIDKVRAIRRSPDPNRVKTTIFDGILSSALPPEDKLDERLAYEAQLIVFAGEGTTAHSLNCALFHLLENPVELAKLKSELKASVSDPENITIAQLDNLPYLGAIIQEAVRLHPGVMARQVRTSPVVPIVYKDPQTQREYIVPPNTVTSMSALDIHLNPAVFGDDAYEFRPQRWIDDPGLSKYFIGFSRGVRNCVGMTLARREMAITIASLFLIYDVYCGQEGPSLELYDTQRARDIDADSDYIFPVPMKGSQGLRVKIRN